MKNDGECSIFENNVGGCQKWYFGICEAEFYGERCRDYRYKQNKG